MPGTARLLRSSIHHDVRGSHTKFFGETPALIHVDDFEVKEVFMTTNRKNVLRGMHFQTPGQAKIIQAVAGSIIVNVLSCQNNNTLGQVKHFIIRAGDGSRVFVPGDWALGYRTLEEKTKILYLANENFSADGDTGIDPFDSDLNLNWSLEGEKEVFSRTSAILSDRDKTLQSFQEFKESLI